MIKDKVFVSFSWEDKPLMERVRKAINKSGSLEAIVVTSSERGDAGLYNTEKVAKGISECQYFVPILTLKSFQNQWVNQEIGYAAAKSKRIYPIVQNELLDERRLKGWIHAERDLPYRFAITENDERKSRKSYREDGYKPLIQFLERRSEFIVFEELCESDKSRVSNGEVWQRNDKHQALLKLEKQYYPILNQETVRRLTKFLEQSKINVISFQNPSEIEFNRTIKWSR